MVASKLSLFPICLSLSAPTSKPITSLYNKYIGITVNDAVAKTPIPHKHTSHLRQPSCNQSNTKCDKPFFIS